LSLTPYSLLPICPLHAKKWEEPIGLDFFVPSDKVMVIGGMGYQQLNKESEPQHFPLSQSFNL
jgi:hypothetical protein